MSSSTSQSRTDLLIADGARIQQWLHARSRMPIMQEFHGIAREVNGVIVAAFGYDHFQDTSCCFHVAADYPWAINRALLQKGFEIPFIQWGYRELLGMVQGGNIASRNLATRLGFQEFAVRRDAHPTGMHFYAMEKKNCRWLELAEKQHDVRRRRNTLSPGYGRTGQRGSTDLSDRDQ